jgi:hypothetical protein
MSFELFARTTTNYLNKFIAKLAQDYDLSEEYIQSLVDNIKNDSTKELKSKETKLIKSDKLDSNSTCIALMKTGARKGEACGFKTSAKSSSGNYCGRHIKSEEEKSTLISKKDNDEFEGQILFYKDNKTGRYVYGNTGLVLKNEKEKIIIGKQIDGIVVDLSPDDIALCKIKRFRYIDPLNKN